MASWDALIINCFYSGVACCPHIYTYGHTEHRFDVVACSIQTGCRRSHIFGRVDQSEFLGSVPYQRAKKKTSFLDPVANYFLWWCGGGYISVLLGADILVGADAVSCLQWEFRIVKSISKVMGKRGVGSTCGWHGEFGIHKNFVFYHPTNPQTNYTINCKNKKKQKLRTCYSK